jgi:hypothetical protein
MVSWREFFTLNGNQIQTDSLSGVPFLHGKGKLRRRFPFIFPLRDAEKLLGAVSPTHYVFVISPCQGSGVGSILIDRTILPFSSAR